MKYINVVSLILILLALVTVIAAALMPISLRKGKTRLYGSLFVSAAFLTASISQMVEARRLWPEAILLVGASFLAWLGIRKYRRAPEGRTRSAQIL
jgi:hypothetical protein